MSDARSGSRQLLLIAGALLAVGLLWLLRGLIVLVGLAIVLAYALDPIVSLIERIPLPRKARVPRGLASGLVVLALVVIAGWLLSLGIPRIVSELGHLLELSPTIANGVLDRVQNWATDRGLARYVVPVVNDLRTNAPATVRTLGGVMAGWIGKLVGGIGQVFGFLLAPLLAFYLLADRDAVRESLMRFMPEGAHETLPRAELALDRALKSYVRGQATVCAAMGVIVGSALASLGYPYALLLAVVVAVAEVLPVIGAFLVCIAVLFVGLSVSPGFALLGVGAYLVINWAVGAFVSPQLMGHHLKMHPFVVTVSVVAGASLLGAAGAMLALPGAAAIQAIVEEFARPRRKQLAGDLEV